MEGWEERRWLAGDDGRESAGVCRVPVGERAPLHGRPLARPRHAPRAGVDAQ